MLGMFEGKKEMSAIDLLKSDHDEVEKMFEEYEDGKDDADAQTKEELVESICKALEVHAELEEELFYPAFRKVEDMEDLLDEAAVEHETVKALVALLEASTPDDMLYDARVKVLSEYVKHHVREEEGEIFPKARSSNVDLEELGRVMISRKEELQQGGAIPAIEQALSKRGSRGRGQPGSKRGGVSKSPAGSRKTSSRGATSRKTSSKGATSKRTSARSR